jgi:RecA-family ATPase
MNVEKIFQLFINRVDCYSLQNKDGSYRKIDEIITEELVKRHLKGEITIGTYQINKKNDVKWICFDIDNPDLEMAEAEARRLYLRLRDEERIKSIALEFSGKKGYHVWIFCKPIDGYSAKVWAEDLLKRIKMKAEIFPKQGKLDAEGYGNLVKLPLGIHQVSGKWSNFIYDEKLEFNELVDIPKAFSKPTISKIERRNEKVKEMPNDIREMIRIGCIEGERHKKRFIIVKELYHSGYSDQEILDFLLIFNRNCNPPERETIVRKHFTKLIENPDKYLAKELESDLITKEEVEKAFEYFTAKEFIKLKIPEPKWQVEGLFTEKSFNILGGYQSTYKTLLGIHIALCMSVGKLVFGKFECKQTKVLYINEELEEGEFQKRMRMIAEGSGIEVNENLILLHFQNLKIDEEGGNKKLMKFIKESEIKFIILDTIREVTNTPENSADEVNKLFTQYIRPIMQRNRCSFLAIQHKGKAGVGTESRQEIDKLRGSSQFRNYTDSALLVDREGKSTRLKISQEKCRVARELDPFYVILNWGKEDITIKVLTEEEVEKSRVDECENLIIKYLDENSVYIFGSMGLLEKVIENKFTNWVFYEAMKNLKKSGLIHFVRRGVYQYKEAGRIFFLDSDERKRLKGIIKEEEE